MNGRDAQAGSSKLGTLRRGLWAQLGDVDPLCLVYIESGWLFRIIGGDVPAEKLSATLVTIKRRGWLHVASFSDHRWWVVVSQVGDSQPVQVCIYSCRWIDNERDSGKLSSGILPSRRRIPSGQHSSFPPRRTSRSCADLISSRSSTFPSQLPLLVRVALRVALRVDSVLPAACQQVPSSPERRRRPPATQAEQQRSPSKLGRPSGGLNPRTPLAWPKPGATPRSVHRRRAGGTGVRVAKKRAGAEQMSHDASTAH